MRARTKMVGSSLFGYAATPFKARMPASVTQSGRSYANCVV